MSENGLLGFWSGLVPRCVAEIMMVVGTTSLTYALNKYVIKKEKDLMQYAGIISELVVSSFVYPYKVVETCMIVNRYQILGLFGIGFWKIRLICMIKLVIGRR